VEIDFPLASLFAGWAMADDVSARLAAAGFDDVRFADGVVFQHLVDGPIAVGALAARMGVSQQAASKSVADLERRGYVSRAADPADGRARLVALADRGQDVVAAGRAARGAVAKELADALGPRRVESARRLLLDVVEELGADAALRSRRVRPPA
jgi:DNA-binding MarR family transcriptional regulator